MGLPLRRALRGLLRQRGVTGLATLTLASGTGLPTATFSMADAALDGEVYRRRERMPRVRDVATSPEPFATLGVGAVRGRDPLTITDAVRAAAFALDRDTPIYEVRDMARVVADGTLQSR